MGKVMFSVCPPPGGEVPQSQVLSKVSGTWSFPEGYPSPTCRGGYSSSGWGTPVRAKGEVPQSWQNSRESTCYAAGGMLVRFPAGGLSSTFNSISCYINLQSMLGQMLKKLKKCNYWNTDTPQKITSVALAPNLFKNNVTEVSENEDFPSI